MNILIDTWSIIVKLNQHLTTIDKKISFFYRYLLLIIDMYLDKTFKKAQTLLSMIKDTFIIIDYR
jgi:hypothetical protein